MMLLVTGGRTGWMKRGSQLIFPLLGQSGRMEWDWEWVGRLFVILVIRWSLNQQITPICCRQIYKYNDAKRNRDKDPRWQRRTGSAIYLNSAVPVWYQPMKIMCPDRRPAGMFSPPHSRFLSSLSPSVSHLSHQFPHTKHSPLCSPPKSISPSASAAVLQNDSISPSHAAQSKCDRANTVPATCNKMFAKCVFWFSSSHSKISEAAVQGAIKAPTVIMITDMCWWIPSTCGE